MKKLAVNSLFAFLFLCISCTVSNNDRRIDFALAAIEENILTTDYSALIEITNVAITDKHKHKHKHKEKEKEKVKTGNEDIVIVKYSAKIMERYNGEKLNKLMFTEFVERSEGFDDIKSGIMIISLCKDKQGNFYLPDIGYEFPAKRILIEKAKEIKILLKNKNLLLQQKGDRYACNFF